MSVEEGLLLACSGFLLAVLWMDLIFDTQVRAARGDEVPEPVLASIADYYRRATTTSRPMSRLIAVVMVILLGALVFRGVRGHDPVWVMVSSALLAGAPILLALIRTVPNAVRLGSRLGGPAEQSRRARSIYRDHVLCFVFMFAFLVLWLVHLSVT
jgi:hypothetical protein